MTPPGPGCGAAGGRPRRPRRPSPTRSRRAGLPEVVRAAARALDASLVLIDRAGSVLAVAARSPADERSLMADAPASTMLELRVADAIVGRLRLRAARGDPPAAVLRVVTTLVASEVERLRAPERASEAAPGRVPAALLRREVTDRGDLVARGGELGVDLDGRRRASSSCAPTTTRPPRTAGAGACWPPPSARARVVRARRARRAARAPDAGAPAGRRAPARRRRGRSSRRAAEAIVARAARRPARLHLRGRPLARRARPARPRPRRQRGAAGRQRRRGAPGRRRRRACSRSRRPAPTACCCRR